MLIPLRKLAVFECGDRLGRTVNIVCISLWPVENQCAVGIGEAGGGGHEQMGGAIKRKGKRYQCANCYPSGYGGN